jgi:hypothetical protein
MILTLTPPLKRVDIEAGFPIAEGHSIISARVNGRPVKTFSKSQVFLQQVATPVRVEVEIQ